MTRLSTDCHLFRRLPREVSGFFRFQLGPSLTLLVG